MLNWKDGVALNTRYTGTVDITGGRRGQAVSSDGVLDVPMRLPKLNGTNTGTNPEQLFAAAWGGCLQGILNAITRKTDIDASNSIVRVEVDLGTNDTGDDVLAARISLAIPGVELAEVERLAHEAHARCPYSKAVAGNIPVEIVAVESLD